TPLAEPAILYFHRRALERAMREEAVMELGEEAGVPGQVEVPGQLTAAIVFVDLSSFTPLAEAMGDVKAAEVLERFSRLVRHEAGGLAGVAFVGLGKRRLKGIAEGLELFAARPAEATARERLVDYVCGMELRPTEVAARLALEGKEFAFCSQECLRRFVAA